MRKRIRISNNADKSATSPGVPEIRIFEIRMQARNCFASELLFFATIHSAKSLLPREIFILAIHSGTRRTPGEREHKSILDILNIGFCSFSSPRRPPSSPQTNKSRALFLRARAYLYFLVFFPLPSFIFIAHPSVSAARTPGCRAFDT